MFQNTDGKISVKNYNYLYFQASPSSHSIELVNLSHSKACRLYFYWIWSQDRGWFSTSFPAPWSCGLGYDEAYCFEFLLWNVPTVLYHVGKEFLATLWKLSTAQARRQKKLQHPTGAVENVALTTKGLQERKTIYWMGRRWKNSK